jgi:hypothetical protein
MFDTSFFIVSADKPGTSGLARSHQLWNMLEAAGLKVQGVYTMRAGEHERGILVSPGVHTMEEVRKIVTTAAQNFEQRSFLEVNQTGHTWDISPYSKQERFLGKSVVVDRLPKDAIQYTSLSNGKFIVLERDVQQ